VWEAVCGCVEREGEDSQSTGGGSLLGEDGLSMGEGSLAGGGGSLSADDCGLSVGWR
jgi:hypothetical protein